MMTMALHRHLQQQQQQQQRAPPLDMWQAAAVDDAEALRALVGASEEEGKEMGNPVDLRDDSGRTALHVAASHGWVLVLEILCGCVCVVLCGCVALLLTGADEIESSTPNERETHTRTQVGEGRPLLAGPRR
jgi:hypothetical protein